MKRIRVKRKMRAERIVTIPLAIRRIGCPVLREQMTQEYREMVESGEEYRANALNREFFPNRDHHTRSWKEVEANKVRDLPTTGDYSLGKSLSDALSFKTRGTEESHMVEVFLEPTLISKPVETVHSGPIPPTRVCTICGGDLETHIAVCEEAPVKVTSHYK